MQLNIKQTNKQTKKGEGGAENLNRYFSKEDI